MCSYKRAYFIILANFLEDLTIFSTQVSYHLLNFCEVVVSRLVNIEAAFCIHLWKIPLILILPFQASTILEESRKNEVQVSYLIFKFPFLVLNTIKWKSEGNYNLEQGQMAENKDQT